MPGHTLDEAAAQAVKQSATATAAAASAKADGTGGGAAAADDHAQLQERLAGYCIGALTSNLIALGEK
jgi:ribosomal protein L12E/L44/L45/RPP1/RPP2